MKIQLKKTSWLLPTAMAVAGLVLLIAATAQGQGTGAAPGDLAQPQAYPLFWAEDFSDPLPPDTYYITATTGSGVVDNDSFLLTQNLPSQRGRIFYLDLTARAEFSATFHLYLGSNEGGADGAAFQFCPMYDYPPDAGGSLDASCPGGYLVAFDTWEEGGGGPDRVYVAYETTSNRLAVADVPNLEDAAWHTAAVLFQQPFITVTLDGSDVIAGAALPGYTPFLGTFGFSAATGAGYNEQRVDAIKVYAPGVGALDGHVYDDTTGDPIEGATVSAGVFAADSDATGYYSMTLPAGSYDVTAEHPQYFADTASGVEIVTGTVATQDFTLVPRVTFDPSAVHITLDWQTTGTADATLTNRMVEPYAFEFLEEDEGFVPLVRGEPVEVTIPAAPAQAPAGTAVAGGPYTPRPALTLDIWPSGNLLVGPNVLLVYADDGSGEPLRSQLLAFGDMGAVDGYDARYGTPSLAELLPYDVVIAWNNYSYFDSTALGDVLADYVDAGGKVILATFNWQYVWFGLGGRFMSEFYSPFLNPNLGNHYATANLGAYDPGHPIMEGVTAASDPYRDYVDLDPGATLVASWDDGEEYVATKGSVVAINSYPGYASIWTGDVDLIFHNAVLWRAVARDVPWLGEEPIAGTVPASGTLEAPGTLDVTIYFSATHDAGVDQPGDYFATLVVDGDPTLEVPVQMTVLAPPDMGKVEGTVLDNCTGEPVEATLVITGGDPITQTVSDPDTGTYAVWLVEGSYEGVFSADGYLDYDATLDVTAGQTTTLDVDLVPDRPCISVEPALLEVWVVTGTLVYTHPTGLDITNDGGQDLEFEILELEGGHISTLGLAGGQPATSDAATAPEGYVPTLSQSAFGDGSPLGGTVCIFKDLDPWGTTEVEAFLAANGIAYEVHTSAEFGTLDFHEFGMIVFSGDQPQAFYDNYAGYVGKFEDYVEGGGFLNFFSADYGWNSGILTAPLPGGTTWTGSSESWNVIDDPAHPVVQGVPNPFYGNYASHGNFTTLPGDAHIIASEQLGGLPTIVEYRLGAGWFIAFGQPLEISHLYGWDAGLIMEQTLLWGDSFIPAAGVPWVWEDPVSGTVPAGPFTAETLNVDVLFSAVVTDPLPLGTYTATLEVLNNDPVAWTQEVVVVMHIVEAYVAPIASFESNSPVCLGETAIFTNTTIPGIPPQNAEGQVLETTYLWDFGDGETSTEFEPTHDYTAAGTYDVSLEACNPAGMCDTYADTVEVLPWPQASFGYEADVLEVTFTNTSLDALTYEWDFGDGTGSTEENPVHTYAGGGTYTVVLTATNDCAIDVYSQAVEVIGLYYYYLPLIHKNYG